MDAPIGRHRSSPLWQRAVELSARMHRLAGRLPGEEAGRLGAQIARATAAVPAEIALVCAAPAGASYDAGAQKALLEAEALLAIAVRLEYLAAADVEPCFARIDELRSGIAPREAGKQVGTRPAVSAPTVKVQSGSAVAPPAPARGVPPVRTGKAGPDAGPAKPKISDRLVVDGCNFLGRAPGYALGDLSSRDRLLFRLQEYGLRHPAHRLIVFFDGQRASATIAAGVEQRVTSGNRPADDVMVDFLRELPAAERARTTLVTDDRELGTRAKTQGARTESVAWLHEQLQRKPTPPNGRAPGLSTPEVAEWETFFKNPPKRPGR